MKPVKIENANEVLIKEGLGNLDVHIDNKNIVSKWELDEADMAYLLEQKQKGMNPCIYLITESDRQEPVWLSTKYPE